MKVVLLKAICVVMRSHDLDYFVGYDVAAAAVVAGDDDACVLQRQRPVAVAERRLHVAEEDADIVIFGRVQQMDWVSCLRHFQEIDPCQSRHRGEVEEVVKVWVPSEEHKGHIYTFVREQRQVMDTKMEGNREMET